MTPARVSFFYLTMQLRFIETYETQLVWGRNYF